MANLDGINENKKLKRKQYKEAGLCACGKQSVDGFSECEHCLFKRKEQDRKKLEKRKFREENHLCKKCEVPLLDGYTGKYCEKCTLHNRKRA